MKIIAINGSPRKNKNTAELLNNALKGAALNGSQTEMINLYDLNYKGCVSCLNCKLKNGSNYGKCSLNDELTPILKKCEDADGLILGSPVYFESITGEMRSFLERLLFPYSVYDFENPTLFTKKIKIGFIYTMNVTRQQMEVSNYNYFIESIEKYINRILGPVESLVVNDTYQFVDYSKYVMKIFDEKLKAKARKEQFPIDLDNAFNLGLKVSLK